MATGGIARWKIEQSRKGGGKKQPKALSAVCPAVLVASYAGGLGQQLDTPGQGAGRPAGRPPAPGSRTWRRCPACVRVAQEPRGQPRARRADRGRGGVAHQEGGSVGHEGRREWCVRQPLVGEVLQRPPVGAGKALGTRHRHLQVPHEALHRGVLGGEGDVVEEGRARALVCEWRGGHLEKQTEHFGALSRAGFLGVYYVINPLYFVVPINADHREGGHASCSALSSRNRRTSAGACATRPRSLRPESSRWSLAGGRQEGGSPVA